MKKFTTVLTLVTACAIAGLSGCSSTPKSEVYEASTDVPSEVPTELPTSESPNLSAEMPTAEPPTASDSSLISEPSPLLADASSSAFTANDAGMPKTSPVDLGASSAGRAH